METDNHCQNLLKLNQIYEKKVYISAISVNGNSIFCAVIVGPTELQIIGSNIQEFLQGEKARVFLYGLLIIWSSAQK